MLPFYRVRCSPFLFYFLWSSVRTVQSHIQPFYLLILSLSFSLTLLLVNPDCGFLQDACYWSGIFTFSTWLQHFYGLKSLAMLGTYEHSFKYEMTILNLICKTLPSLILGLQYWAVVSPSSPVRTDCVEMEPCWTMSTLALCLSLSLSK